MLRKGLMLIEEEVIVEDVLSAPAKRAVVVSLRFSPAFTSHMIAFGKLLENLGYSVSFLADKDYLSFADFAAIGPVITTERYAGDPDSLDADMAVFCNPAVKNASVARAMRARGMEVLYLLHEPVPVRHRLREGWKEILKLVVARQCSLAMLRQSSAVLVPSSCARASYERYFMKFNPIVCTLPLLFDDEISRQQIAAAREKRRYFSFLASAIKAHDFDAYVAFVKYAIRQGSSMQFAIATRTDLNGYLTGDAELASYAASGRIRIQHGRALTNEEMNGHFLDSFCVWNVYKVSTQSGVLARAFMAGTPVIAMRMGSFDEFIVPGSSGEFVAAPDDWRGLLAHAKSIQENFPAYCEGCRRAFMKFFYYGEAREKLALLLTHIEKEKQECALP